MDFAIRVSNREVIYKKNVVRGHMNQVRAVSRNRDSQGATEPRWGGQAQEGSVRVLS